LDLENPPYDPVQRLRELGQDLLADKLEKRLLRHPDAAESYSWMKAPETEDTTEESW
jgi:hypothetical protein